jgi:uncharacterized protein (TIGR02996 family)
MNDRELAEHPLFSAIRQEPDSDEARLVLADALIEEGEPRGELIVAQCELASVLGDAPVSNDGWGRARLQMVQPEKLEKRIRKITRQQNALLKKNPQWEALDVDDHVERKFWRGLTHEIATAPHPHTVERCLNEAPMLARLRLSMHYGAILSVDEVTEDTNVEESLEVLLAHDVRHTIELLELPLATASLIERLDLPRLRHLRLANCSEDALFALAKNRRLPRLKALDLRGGYREFDTPVPSRESIAALFASDCFEISELTLSEAIPLDAKLATSLASLAGLSKLRLLDATVDDDAMNRLLRSSHAPQLERLAAYQSKLEPRTLELLADTWGERLTMLDLDSSRIKPSGAKALFGANRLTGLRALHLRNSWIRDEGVEHLVESQTFGGLWDLNLRSNRLTTESAQLIAKHADGTLLKLNINNNSGIKRVGVDALWTSKGLSQCRIFTNHRRNA